MNKELLMKAVESHIVSNIADATFYSNNKHPQRSEIVLAYHFIGKEYCFDNQFGRVVQIRLGCGQFGSDMYFLRMPNGDLMTAENQSFRKVPEQFYEQVASHFTMSIDDEVDGFEMGYTIGGDQLEVGFIVDGKNTKGSPDTSFSITVTG